MMMTALAYLAAAGPATGEVLSVGAIVLLLGAMGTFVATVLRRDKIREEGKRAGQREVVEVKLEKDFVTRREFEKLESRLEVSMTECRGLFGETMAELKAHTNLVLMKLDGQNDRLTQKIEAVASGAYQSRGKIHQTLNSTREELKELKAVSNVADHLGKLADAIQHPQQKVQPIHPNQS